MIKLGEVLRSFELSSGIVLSLRLTTPSTRTIRIGDTILINGIDAAIVRGHKHWPENNELDILIDSKMPSPGIGSPVYFPQY